MKTLLFILAAFYSFIARADLIQTNYTLTPKATQFDLRGDVRVSRGKGEFPQSNTTVTSNGFGILGTALYGVNDNLALGLDLGYASVKSTYTGGSFKANGILPLGLTARSNMDLGGITFYSEATLNLDLQKSRTNNDDDTSNVSSGQPQLGIGIGVISQLTAIKVGVMGGYSKRFDGEAEEVNSGVTSTNKLSQGDSMVLAVLAELDNEFHPSLRLARIMNYQTKSESGNTTTYTGSRNYTQANLMARLDLSEALQILPSLSYLSSDKRDDDSKTTNVEVGAMVRYLF